MVQGFRACRSVLLLGVFLTAAHGYGQEIRNDSAGVKPALQEMKSLKASISRRELELALRERKEVLAEVKKRIQDLGLSASAEELTGLLEKRAYLEIAIDKCKLANDSCGGDKSALAAVEASFRAKAGISTREFRSGRRDDPARDAEIARLASGRSATKAYGDTCSCAFTVYSQDRFMNQYWGLECNNHASHGFCSNNVDSAHTPGIGAMTGDVYLFFGSNSAHRECPDNQRTCFKGPSTDHLGSWGNACNCDTWHSQYYNPFIQWYGGDLSDSEEVDQLYTAWMSAPGACNEASVSVKEFIKENDPWCCDDPMGDLWASLPLANGYGSVSAPAATTNCNGGSQSGRYPYCGSFGATIKVVYNCYTTSPPPPPECDPWAEQDCRDMGWGWAWDSSTCTCQDADACPPPPPNCGYWDERSCLCWD